MEKQPKVEGYYRFIYTCYTLDDTRLKIGLECGHQVIVRIDIPMWNNKFFDKAENTVFCFKCGNMHKTS